MTAPSPAAEPPDGLREAIRDELGGWQIGSGYYGTSVLVHDAAEMADALLAGPLAPLLDRAAKAEAAVARAEALAEELDEKPHTVSPIVPRVDISRRIRRALDGAS